MYTIYQVQNGDTLASVASKVGIPIDELSKLNGIMVSAVLNPGDFIVIPKVSNNMENAYFKTYSIQNGDTIYGIARQYNVNPEFLLRLNGLNKDDVIYPGETIFVPREGVAFYITEGEDTLNDVIRRFGVSASEIANQNNTIYLTPDQLIVYKK